jgi:hypothetical protein
MDWKLVKDPELRDFVKLANVSTEEIAKGAKRFAHFLPEDFAPATSGASVLRNYPLLSHSYGGLQSLQSETIIYVNASYEARTKGDGNVSGTEEA